MLTHRKARVTLLKVISTLLVSSCLSAQSSASSILAVGPIKVWPLGQHGCACEFYPPQTDASAYLLSDIEGKIAWLNLDGADVKLELQSSTHQGRSWVDGTTFERVYIHKNVPIKVSFQVGNFRGEDFWLGGREVQGWPMQASIASGPAAAALVTGGCGC